MNLPLRLQSGARIKGGMYPCCCPVHACKKRTAKFVRSPSVCERRIVLDPLWTMAIEDMCSAPAGERGAVDLISPCPHRPQLHRTLAWAIHNGPNRAQTKHRPLFSFKDDRGEALIPPLDMAAHERVCSGSPTCPWIANRQCMAMTTKPALPQPARVQTTAQLFRRAFTCAASSWF
jgi:hypothetical protein